MKNKKNKTHTQKTRSYQDEISWNELTSGLYYIIVELFYEQPTKTANVVPAESGQNSGK